MRKLLLSLSIMFGCVTPPQGIAVYNPYQAAALEELPAEVSKACEMWQIECYSLSADDDSVRGDIVLELVPDNDFFVIGRAFGHKGCYRNARSTRSARVIAHELGHLMGLKHWPHSGNLMHQSSGHELTESQIEKFHEGLRRYATQCPD